MIQFQCWRCGRLVSAEQVRRQPMYLLYPDRVNVCPECYARGAPLSPSTVCLIVSVVPTLSLLAFAILYALVLSWR